MTSVDLVMARHNKKKLAALQELYFNAITDLNNLHELDGYRRSRYKLDIWEYSREIKELDQKLTKYYEHTKINNQQLPTVGQMGVTRVTQKLGDHDLKIRSYFIHN